MSYNKKLKIFSFIGAIFSFCMLVPDLLWAEIGPYLQSAHGSNSYGVKRSEMTGYARGNCAHCHEMHASIAGSEPLPGGGPSPYTLFATNFNSSVATDSQSYNFCFYCHSTTLSLQSSLPALKNKDYSETFGGASVVGVQSIMAAFNQPGGSSHNLGDIHTFAEGKFSWYSVDSNPCNACHNPHLAKRNWENIPTQSAISKPSDHFNLWGESQLMSTAYPNQYEAPYAASASVREPAGDAVNDGSKTPDYVGFCTDCHNISTDIYSTTKVDDLIQIDWSSNGEKHGGLPRGAVLRLAEPYSSAGKTNFVLSCLDCHEPHGSANIMLLRRRVNGGDLGTTITSTDNMKALCGRCHAILADQKILWQSIHHDTAAGAPYEATCGGPVYGSGCHSSGGAPIPCGNCHFHGSDDSWLLGRFSFAEPTYRKTF